ncbi:acyl carrier protein [Streptomyces pseudovenezuelae]|uniref:Acyl carrier protein n=1 Tax=Streptomyces pseudovenezuelae TaxID=67350 RepID=A0ABT6M0R4_9ACTN|nr:acyl carrier protein [Streptomyces pseudovenezuelae]MDH6222140.1 acyl carrier protein [Streptomyces pseudovenezuelae]
MSTPSAPTFTEFVNLCAQIFKVPDLSPEVSILDNGGDSLLVARLAVELDERWGIQINILDVYTAANVRELYDGVRGVSRAE